MNTDKVNLNELEQVNSDKFLDDVKEALKKLMEDGCLPIVRTAACVLYADPNPGTCLSPMLLHDPVAKAKASASYGARLQAHDRTAGTPDEREIS